MNTKRGWTRVTVVVVLALASLSSMAMSAPHHDRLKILAVDLCGVAAVSQFDQYAAAIEWAEQGGTEVPFALTVSCVENDVALTASQADLGGDSWVRLEQYMAAIEDSAPALIDALTHTVTGGGTRKVQYQSAVESSGRVRTFAPQAPTGEHDQQLFARYLASVANAGHGPTFASEADRGKPN